MMVYGLVLSAVGACQAQIKLCGDTMVTFATADEGRKILTARDDFVRALSPFDRAARVKTAEDVPEKAFLEFVGRNTQYIIHPEEILADNFAMLVMEDQDVPSPEILQKLREVLMEKVTPTRH